MRNETLSQSVSQTFVYNTTVTLTFTFTRDILHIKNLFIEKTRTSTVDPGAITFSGYSITNNVLTVSFINYNTASIPAIVFCSVTVASN